MAQSEAAVIAQYESLGNIDAPAVAIGTSGKGKSVGKDPGCAGTWAGQRHRVMGFREALDHGPVFRHELSELTPPSVRVPAPEEWFSGAVISPCLYGG